MKKVVNSISIIFIILLFYITKESDMLTLTISFSIYLMLGSIFSSTSIKSSNYKVFKLGMFSVLALGSILTIISYFIGNILNIDKLNIINIFMSISLISNILLKLTKDYIENINYKKLSNNILNIYKITTITIRIILLILLFKVFNLDNYISIIILYSVDIIISLLLAVILYLLVFKKIKKENKDKINYKKEIKNILIGNKIVTIYNIINSSYIYISIIILYYILNNRYNYSYNDLSTYITNTYLYGIIALYIIHQVIKKYLNINVEDDFNNNAKKIIKTSLAVTILLIIISKPLSLLIFGSNYNILASIIPLIFMYTFYDFIIKTNIQYNKEKNIITVLIIGLITKIIFELPLINTAYRMGYTLALGSTFSIILGLIISVIMGIILIKNKLKVNLLDNFNNILNIIYENIIYTFILVLCTLIIKTDTNNIISSILVIIFYLFISFLFQIIKRILSKK